MKVKKIEIGNEQKKYMTVYTFEKAKEISKTLLKDNEGFQTEIEILESMFGRGECLTVSAEMALNERAMNNYGDESYHIDVWLDVTIDASRLENKIFKVGCYLSDIWNVSSRNRDEIKSHMFIRTFTEER